MSEGQHNVWKFIDKLNEYIPRKKGSSPLSNVLGAVNNNARRQRLKERGRGSTRNENPIQSKANTSRRRFKNPGKVSTTGQGMHQNNGNPGNQVVRTSKSEKRDEIRNTRQKSESEFGKMEGEHEIHLLARCLRSVLLFLVRKYRRNVLLLSELTVLVSQSFVSLGCWRVDGSQGSRKHHHLIQATDSHSELQIGIQSATDQTKKCSSDEGCGSDAPQTLVAISCSFIISSMVKNNRPTPDLPSTC